MAGQTKVASFIEACISTFAGLLVSFALQKLLNAVYGVHMSNGTAFMMVFWFTVFSIARSYVVRRMMNSEFWKATRAWRWWVQRKHKGSTKNCHQCGNPDLLLLRTHNKKICTDCGTHIEWNLAVGQRPLH